MLKYLSEGTLALLILITMSIAMIALLNYLTTPEFKVGDCVREIGYKTKYKITVVKGNTIELVDSDGYFTKSKASDLTKTDCSF